MTSSETRKPRASLVLALTASLALSSPALTVPPGLVHHWSFDEGPNWHDDPLGYVPSTLIARDPIGGLDASFTGSASPPWVAGRQFTGAQLDGVDGYFETGGDLGDVLGGTASLSFWIRTTDVGSTVGFFSPGVTGVEQAAGVDDVQWGWIDDQGHVALSVGDTTVVRSSKAINDGTWHFVALTRDASTGSATLWLDGLFDDTGVGPAGTIGTPFSSLGRIEDTGGSPVYLRGRIDQIHVFDRVVDADTVAMLFDNHAPKLWDVSFEGVHSTVWSTGDVLLQAYDPEGDQLAVLAFSQPAHASVDLLSEGGFEVTPQSGWVGSDYFEVTIEDGRGGLATARVELLLADPPPAGAAELRTTTFAPLAEVLADGVSTALTGLRVPRLLDWDGDLDLDLVVGNAGAVWLYENTGSTSIPTFGAGVRVQAGGSDIALSGPVAIAFADMTGDAVDDLVAVDDSLHLLVFENQSSAGQVPVYGSSTPVPSTEGGAFDLPDRRFDLADVDLDGLPDVIVGSFSGDVEVYLNAGSASAPELDPASPIILETNAHNLYPRVADLSRGGGLDLLRGINWGAIDYWLAPGFDGTLGPPFGSLTVADAGGSPVDFHSLLDGVVPELADLDGDEVLDLVVGGHAGSAGLYWAPGDARGFADSIAAIEAIYDLEAGALGNALDANDQELLEQVRTEERNLLLHLVSTPVAQRDALFADLATHVGRYPFLQMGSAVDTTKYHHLPSIAGQNLMFLDNLGPDTSDHRRAVADAVGLSGSQRQIYLEAGLHIGDNQEGTQGQVESVLTFMRWEPRRIFPDAAVTLGHYRGDGREGWVGTFEGAKNTFDFFEGEHINEWAADLDSALSAHYGVEERVYWGDGFTFVLGHEATHSLDAYVRSRRNEDLERHWGQILVDAAGPDVIPGADAWVDWDATRSHFQASGWWDGDGATWDSAWTDYWASGSGSAWRDLSFMRGSIDFFLQATQESLATQANQHWAHSEARLIGALDRFDRGVDQGIPPMLANLTEVVTFLDFLSAGLDKVVMYDTRGVQNPYPHAEYHISHAWLERDDLGRVVALEHGDRYEFELDVEGRVTGYDEGPTSCPTDLSLTNSTIVGTRTYRADQTITLGPELRVDGAPVASIAGQRIVLVAGTEIGGSFEARIDSAACPVATSEASVTRDLSGGS